MEKSGGLQSYLQTHPDNKSDDNSMDQAFQTQQVASQTCIFMYQAPARPSPSCLPAAYSNTGFDTNSCHLVRFTSEGKSDVHCKKGKEEERA